MLDSMLNAIIWKRRLFLLETKLNCPDHYGRRNNLVLSGNPDTVEDKDLESTVSSKLSETDVTVEPHDLEACHRIGLFGKNKPKKQSLD